MKIAVKQGICVTALLWWQQFCYAVNIFQYVVFFKWKAMKYSSDFYLFSVSVVIQACGIYHVQGSYKCEINQPEWSWGKLVIY
jgi:hypothetical protein